MKRRILSVFLALCMALPTGVVLANTEATVCNLVAHTHEAQCYDETGALLCEVLEHDHSGDGSVTEVPKEPILPEEPMLPQTPVTPEMPETPETPLILEGERVPITLGTSIPVITEFPTVPETSVYGKKLGDIPLSGGNASFTQAGTEEETPVEGTFSWVTPDVVPVYNPDYAFDGHTTYEVLFTPTDGSTYATARGLVAVPIYPKVLDVTKVTVEIPNISLNMNAEMMMIDMPLRSEEIIAGDVVTVSGKVTVGQTNTRRKGNDGVVKVNSISNSNYIFPADEAELPNQPYVVAGANLTGIFVAEGTVSPSFNLERSTYSATVGDVEKVNLTLTKDAETVKVEVQRGGGWTTIEPNGETYPIPVVSGTTSAASTTRVKITGSAIVEGETYTKEYSLNIYTPVTIEGGLITDRNGNMAYVFNSSGNMDIKGKYQGDWLSTTYSDQGYSVYAEVNDGEVKRVKSNNQPQSIDGDVSIRVKAPEFVNGGKQLKVGYEVKNSGTANATFSLGAYTDVQIGSNDSADIYELSVEAGKNIGFKMIDDETEAQFNFFGKEAMDVTDVDQYYYGAFDGDQIPHVFKKNTEISSKPLIGEDSIMSYSWQNRTIAPNATQQFSILIGIGGKGSDQDLQGAENPNIIVDLPPRASFEEKAFSKLVIDAEVSRGVLSYQWYVNSQDSTAGATKITGADRAQYSPPTNVKGIQYYYCVIENYDKDSTATIKTAKAFSSIVKVAVVAELPAWIKKAGLTVDMIEYSPETGELKFKEVNVQLTGPIIIPDGTKVIFDLNGKTVTAPPGDAAIKTESGANVSIEIKGGGESGGTGGAIVGSNGENGADGAPAIDFSGAGSGSSLGLDQISIQGGNGGSGTEENGGNGGNGGVAIKGNDNISVSVSGGSSVSGGDGGVATGTGSGGDGGIGADGGKITIGAGSTAGGGSGGTSVDGNGGSGGTGAAGAEIVVSGNGSGVIGGSGGGTTGSGTGGSGGAGSDGEKITIGAGSTATGGTGGTTSGSGTGGSGGTGASGTEVVVSGSGSGVIGGSGGATTGSGTGGSGGAGSDGGKITVESDAKTEGGNGGVASGGGDGGVGGVGSASDKVIVKPDGSAAGGVGGTGATGGVGGDALENKDYEDVNGEATGGIGGIGGDGAEAEKSDDGLGAEHPGFDLRDGSGIHYMATVPETTLATAAWQAKGYSIAGWYARPDDQTNPMPEPPKEPIKGKTYYAFWEKNGTLVRTTTLDLTMQATNLEDAKQGWSWNATTKTLTLDGVIFDTPRDVALKLPAGATINLTEGSENYIGSVYAETSQNTYGIEAAGALTINGIGSLQANAGTGLLDSYGIKAGSLALGNEVQLEMRGTTGAYVGGVVMLPPGSAIQGATSIDGVLKNAIASNGGGKGQILVGTTGEDGVAKHAKIVFVGYAAVGPQKLSPLIAGDEPTTTFDAATYNFKESLTTDNIRIQWFSDFGGKFPTKAPDGVTVVATACGAPVPGMPTMMSSVMSSARLKESNSIELTATIAAETKAGSYYFKMIAECGDQVATSGVASLSVIRMSDISGVVTKAEAKIQGATVTLMQGVKAVQTTMTDPEGAYVLTKIPSGLYNLVVKIETKKITVPINVNADVVVKDVAFPDFTGNQNTVVKTEANTPPVVSDLNGLFSEAVVTEDTKGITEKDQDVVTDGGTVELKLTAQAKAEDSITTDVSAIKALADDAKAQFLFLDLSAMKTVTPTSGTKTTTTLSELNGLVDIVIQVPENKRGEGLRVFRMHDYGDGAGAVAEELTESPNIDGEKIAMSSDFAYVTLTVKKFSTYALMKGFEFSVTVLESEASAKGDGKYEPGAIVSIDAGVKSGFTFDGWTTANEITFANSKSEKTTFVMPEKQVTVTANWKSVSGGVSVPSAPEKKPVDKPVNKEPQVPNQGTLAGEERIEGEQTIFVVNEEKTSELIGQMPEKGTVTVTVSGDKPVSSVELLVKNAEEMKEKEMILSVVAGDVVYNLPTDKMDFSVLQESLGTEDMSQAVVQITMTKEEGAVLNQLQEMGQKDGFTLVGVPVDFKVTVSIDGKTMEMKVFQGYVQRILEIPGDVANKITTAVRFEADGKVSHVPTFVYQEGQKQYAKINSVTNSTYALIYNEASFADATGQWYEGIVSEMAARKIIAGQSADVFGGTANITRAEFANIVVRALGLPVKAEDASVMFADVTADQWYYHGVVVAAEYGIVSGRSASTFAPNETITREEAMVMMQNAAKITGLTGTTQTATTFADMGAVAPWAKEAVMFNVNNALMVGADGMIAPKDNITRAETAAVVLRLLQKSVLVDVRN